MTRKLESCVLEIVKIMDCLRLKPLRIFTKLRSLASQRLFQVRVTVTGAVVFEKQNIDVLLLFGVSWLWQKQELNPNV